MDHVMAVMANPAVIVAAFDPDGLAAFLTKTFGSLLLTGIGIYAIPHLSQSRRTQLIQYVGLAIGVLIIFFAPQALKAMALKIASYLT